jgi:hypothetical protein
MKKPHFLMKIDGNEIYDLLIGQTVYDTTHSKTLSVCVLYKVPDRGVVQKIAGSALNPVVTRRRLQLSIS